MFWCNILVRYGVLKFMKNGINKITYFTKFFKEVKNRSPGVKKIFKVTFMDIIY